MWEGAERKRFALYPDSVPILRQHTRSFDMSVYLETKKLNMLGGL